MGFLPIGAAVAAGQAVLAAVGRMGTRDAEGADGGGDEFVEAAERTGFGEAEVKEVNESPMALIGEKIRRLL